MTTMLLMVIGVSSIGTVMGYIPQTAAKLRLEIARDKAAVAALKEAEGRNAHPRFAANFAYDDEYALYDGEYLDEEYYDDSEYYGDAAFYDDLYDNDFYEDGLYDDDYYAEYDGTCLCIISCALSLHFDI